MVPAPLPSSTTARASLAEQVSPRDVWVLAPLIAGQPFYKTGHWQNGKFQYPRPTTLPRVTRTLPEQPAAVLVHGVDGSVATLCLDLDTSKAGVPSSCADAERLGELLTDCRSALGGRLFPQRRPPPVRSAGASVWTARQARELVEAMTLWL